MNRDDIEKEILELEEKSFKLNCQLAKNDLSKYTSNVINYSLQAKNEKVKNKKGEVIQFNVPFSIRNRIGKTARKCGKTIDDIMEFFTVLSIKYYEYSVLTKQKKMDNKICYPLIPSQYIKIKDSEKRRDPDKVFYYVDIQTKEDFLFAVAKKRRFFDSTITQKIFISDWVELAIQVGDIKYQETIDIKYCLLCNDMFFETEEVCSKCEKSTIDAKCLVFID